MNKLEQQQMSAFIATVMISRPDISKEELGKITGWFESVLQSMHAVNLVVEGRVLILWDDETNQPAFGVRPEDMPLVTKSETEAIAEEEKEEVDTSAFN